VKDQRPGFNGAASPGGAIAWLSNTRLLVAAEIMAHSNCDSNGTFVAYEFDVSARRVGRRYGQLEVKQRWSEAIGDELRNASDECIRHPHQCAVPYNHPDQGRPVKR